MAQTMHKKQLGLGPGLQVGDGAGLGFDPFNLMPIIEYHQKARKMKQQKGDSLGVFLRGVFSPMLGIMLLHCYQSSKKDWNEKMRK